MEKLTASYDNIMHEICTNSLPLLQKYALVPSNEASIFVRSDNTNVNMCAVHNMSHHATKGSLRENLLLQHHLNTEKSPNMDG